MLMRSLSIFGGGSQLFNSVWQLYMMLPPCTTASTFNLVEHILFHNTLEMDTVRQRSFQYIHTHPSHSLPLFLS